jgi:phage terminase small subunit
VGSPFLVRILKRGDYLLAKDKYGLTSNQRAFADEYIKNKGNATQAYLFAYQSCKKETVAATNGARLLRNAKVSRYIADRTDELLEKAKMNQSEIIMTLSSIARREKQKSYTKVYDHLTGEITKETTAEFQPSIEESIKALEVLVKFLGSPLENEKIKVQITKTKAEIEALSSVENKEDKLDKLLNLVEGDINES